MRLLALSSFAALSLLSHRAGAAPCPSDGRLLVKQGCYVVPATAEPSGSGFRWIASGRRLALRATTDGVSLSCTAGEPVDLEKIECPPPDAEHADAVVRTTDALRVQGEIAARALEAQQRAIAEALSALLTEPVYLPIVDILPGQSRYARENVLDKVKAAEKKGAVMRVDGALVRAFDSGRSILPLSAALPVVVGPSGLVLVDGHHDLLSSIELGATTVPVKKVADLTELSVDEFWKEADARGLVYPHAVGGAWQIPPRNFGSLVDDPIRYFAARTALKCVGGKAAAGSDTDDGALLWTKVDKDVPFIEFKIADALVAHGFHLAGAEDNVAAARKILVDYPIPGLRVAAENRTIRDSVDLCATAQ